MEQSKAMGYESRKASSEVLKPRNMYIFPEKLIFNNTAVSIINLALNNFLFSSHKVLSVRYDYLYEQLSDPQTKQC
jgi:hypothetical protein